jgi:hypothetical protein
MKKSAIYIVIFIYVYILSCSKNDLDHNYYEDEQPTAMSAYCQNSKEKELKRVEYEYENGILKTETSIMDGKIDSKKSFEYNSEMLVFKETYEAYRYKLEKSFLYNKSNQVINIISKTFNYNAEGQVTDSSEKQTPLEYERNLLVKEWESWGGYNTYEYKYGKVTIKKEHTANGELHQISYFKFSGLLKIEEKKTTASGSIIYVRNFKYNNKGKLTSIAEDGNIIEEDIYSGNRLIEKRTFYFGIDPGFSPCSGNFIYRYEY